MNVTFTVGSINERTVNTKRGPAKAYDLIATDGTKYGFGFTTPSRVGITVGSTVSGEATASPYGLNVDGKSVRVEGGEAAASGGSTPTPVSTFTPRKPYVEKTFPVPPTHGDMAIIRQNALTNSVATVAEFVATQPPEKWPDLAAWRSLVIETAYEFAKFSSGHREIEALEKLRGVGVTSSEITSAIAAHNEAA